MTQSRRYLEEIVRHTRRIALRDWVLPLAGLGVELQEGVLEVIVDLHDRRLVTTPVAVIRCGKNRDDVAIMCPIVALHDELVRTGQKLQTVDVVEPGCEAYPVSGFSRAGSKNVHRITCK